jgi:hypothetical protein
MEKKDERNRGRSRDEKSGEERREVNKGKVEMRREDNEKSYISKIL